MIIPHIALRAFLAIALFLMMTSVSTPQTETPTTFKRIPLQYIVALGDSSASSGTGAQSWGLWNQDPGPRGCLLEDFDKLKSANGIAPAQWKFDTQDWWLEEHGALMEKPVFPLPPGKYVVTGGRRVTAVLTIYSADKNGVQRWELDKGAKLYDVTHLPCHAARYTPAKSDQPCSPDIVKKTEFPVAPGVPMPEVGGCHKQEYAVLFVIGVAVEK